MVREKCLVCPTDADIDLKSGTYDDIRCLQCGRYQVVDFADGELSCEASTMR